MAGAQMRHISPLASPPPHLVASSPSLNVQLSRSPTPRSDPTRRRQNVAAELRSLTPPLTHRRQQSSRNPPAPQFPAWIPLGGSAPMPVGSSLQAPVRVPSQPSPPVSVACPSGPLLPRTTTVLTAPYHQTRSSTPRSLTPPPPWSRVGSTAAPSQPPKSPRSRVGSMTAPAQHIQSTTSIECIPPPTRKQSPLQKRSSAGIAAYSGSPRSLSPAVASTLFAVSSRAPQNGMNTSGSMPGLIAGGLKASPSRHQRPKAGPSRNKRSLSPPAGLITKSAESHPDFQTDTPKDSKQAESVYESLNAQYPIVSLIKEIIEELLRLPPPSIESVSCSTPVLKSSLYTLINEAVCASDQTKKLTSRSLTIDDIAVMRALDNEVTWIGFKRAVMRACDDSGLDVAHARKLIDAVGASLSIQHHSPGSRNASHVENGHNITLSESCVTLDLGHGPWGPKRNSATGNPSSLPLEKHNALFHERNEPSKRQPPESAGSIAGESARTTLESLSQPSTSRPISPVMASTGDGMESKLSNSANSIPPLVEIPLPTSSALQPAAGNLSLGTSLYAEVSQRLNITGDGEDVLQVLPFPPDATVELNERKAKLLGDSKSSDPKAVFFKSASKSKQASASERANSGRSSRSGGTSRSPPGSSRAAPRDSPTERRTPRPPARPENRVQRIREAAAAKERSSSAPSTRPRRAHGTGAASRGPRGSARGARPRFTAGGRVRPNEVNLLV